MEQGSPVGFALRLFAHAVPVGTGSGTVLAIVRGKGEF